jgi:hypothetical protein
MGAVEGVSLQQGVACDCSFDRGVQQMRGQRHWQYERRFDEQALLHHAAAAVRDHAPSPLFVRRRELQHRIRLQATNASRALRQRSPEAAYLAVVPALDAAQRAAVAEQAWACVCDVSGAGRRTAAAHVRQPACAGCGARTVEHEVRYF